MTASATQRHGPLVVYGAGGHGRVVAEAAASAGWQVLGFLDDGLKETPSGSQWPLLPVDDPRLVDAAHIVALGDNTARRRITAELRHAGRRLVAVIHPSASVSGSAKIGQGVFIGPAAVVHTAASIGDGVIINSGAIVEHDCSIEDFVHIAPGAVLGGGAAAGEGSLIGINASVLPRLRVGCWCVVGAGAVVVRNVMDNSNVAGVPARPLQQA